MNFSLKLKTYIYSIDEFPNKTSRNRFYVNGYWCCNIYAKGLQACWYRNRSAQKRWWFIDVNWFAVGLMIHLILWMEEILHHLGWLKPFINNGIINHLSTAAGFLPSIVVGYSSSILWGWMGLVSRFISHSTGSNSTFHTAHLSGDLT